jgi:archaemetzincin
VFGADVRTYSTVFDAEDAYDTLRQQYNSTVLLERLYREAPSGRCKVLGVTEYDLFVPVLTFVFGEAQLGGRAAVASSHRLRNDYYGLADDRTLLIDRFKKEVVHELGHTLGLVHCPVPTCVMYSTTAVEEVDLKTHRFCAACCRKAGLS